MNTGKIDNHTIAQNYQSSLKSSNVHPSQNEQTNRQTFDLWFAGFTSCLKLVSPEQSSNINADEIYQTVKQQKAA
jgi:hypothetical protein